MLKVSTRTTYAIRSLLDIARQQGEEPIQLASLAQRQNIPLPYLHQIFAKLKKAGLVVTVRGPKGGYRLAKAPEATSVAEIVRALEGPMQPTMCSYPEHHAPGCTDTDGCPNHNLCGELDGSIRRILAGNNLRTLLQEAGGSRHAPPAAAGGV